MAKSINKVTVAKTTVRAKKAAAKVKAKPKLPLVEAQAAAGRTGVTGEVLDRLWAVVMDRRSADPAHSHSARLLSRGISKVAQKFGEEAVECLIEAATGNKAALVAESADVLYHLMVMWVAAGVEPADVWSELGRRESVSGILEKASRSRSPIVAGTTKIP